MTAVNLSDKDLAFVHVPKSGGSSVVQWLTANFVNAELIKGHPNLNMMKSQWTINRSFAIVRNPWSRLVSAYFYLKQYGFYWGDNNIEKIEDFPSWDTFVKNLDYDTKSWNVISTNQIEWLSGDVQIIMKMENLAKDFSIVQDILNCHHPLPHINASEHDDYRSYYTTEQINHIAKVYERDIDIFKYTF